MSRGLALFAVAAVAGFLLAAFEVWYVALPKDTAAALDFCRWTEHIDCFESLYRNRNIFAILAALAGVLLFESTLAFLALGAGSPEREAWGGLARLASFPGSGLAIYLLLDDFLVTKKTSPMAILIVALSVAQNVQAVIRGGLGGPFRAGARAPVAVALACALAAYLGNGAATYAHQAGAIEEEAQAAPPAVIIPDFATDIPRQGAFPLGDARAPNEILLFLDPAEETSRALLRDALVANTPGVILEIYLKDRVLPADARPLLEAAARGDPLPDPEPSPLPARTVAAAKITEYPTAIWKGGRRTGPFTLADILTAAVRN
jgi:hypothetical protein